MDDAMMAAMKESYHEDDDDDSSTSSDGEEATTEFDDSNSDKNVSEDRLSRKETEAVSRSKLLVYLTIIIAATIVGTLTYFFISKEETQEFERELFAYGKEIATASEANAKNIFGQLHVMSTTVTSYAESINATWPNVTLPHFGLRAREAEELSGIELIVFSPIVTNENRLGFEQYAREHQGWIEEDLVYYHHGDDELHSAGSISNNIYPYTNANDADEYYYNQRFHVPVWQLGPVPKNASIVNLDLYSHPAYRTTANDVLETEHQLLSQVTSMDFLLEQVAMNYTRDGHPRSFLLEPVFESFTEASPVIAFLTGEVAWERFFADLLEDVQGILVDVKGTCGDEFTYIINGHQAEYAGEGDLHDPKYDHLGQTFEFAEFARYDGPFDGGLHCEYTLSIYPTETFESSYHTMLPVLYTSVVVLVFLFTGFIFAIYDLMVYRRQTMLLRVATRTSAIVSSLFPKNVQMRIMEDAERQDFANNDKESLEFDTKPIADLYTSVTVMFADIVGFTAWSSAREPAQVFTLLETIYHEYDQIAKRRRVFKVETVGDCYVAAAGLPEKRKDHAVAMARFARDCLYTFDILMKKLELQLGPDTSDLGMRFGLHSGPVTAGVLRGERARFQLFGDTMNTTARIETTGAKNKIHLSQETADLLAESGKGHWFRAREDTVVAKGKGELTTYWLELKRRASMSSRSDVSTNSEIDNDDRPETDTPATYLPASGITDDSVPPLCDKSMRLVNWNADVLAKLLKEIVVHREAAGIEAASKASIRRLERKQQSIALEEVADTIKLPTFDSAAALKQRDLCSVDLGDAVCKQLSTYVLTIANHYRDNAFHNFEHASHVTMSVMKLLSRIVAPDIESEDKENVAKDLHDHTYGITSDPLTQFAVILSALVHDVDHPGVPNTQLVKEQSDISALYKNKSVAEQKSVDIAWEILMEDRFEDLRGAIYSTEAEFKRFRQLIVNSVLATDIIDKELNAARKLRWNKAFATSIKEGFSEVDNVNRKATIVLEHLIQASDVAHTMQHWIIYRKWNARLFHEMYKAYVEGRSDNDPSVNWYEGELAFFDFYIIPLAKKLKDCGVFGVSSDEYLNYALQNRKEFERKGRMIVEEMLEAMPHARAEQ